MTDPTQDLLTSPGPELDAAIAIEKACFPEESFDLPTELDRSYARIWLTRPAPAQLPVGFLLGWLVADELHILTVAVDPVARRAGHGSRLVRQAIDAGVSARCRSLLLEVRRGNTAAIGLYRAHHFAVVGVRPRYYGDGEDAVLMTLFLDEQGHVIPTPDDPALS